MGKRTSTPMVNKAAVRRYVIRRAQHNRPNTTPVLVADLVYVALQTQAIRTLDDMIERLPVEASVLKP